MGYLDVHMSHQRTFIHRKNKSTILLTELDSCGLDADVIKAICERHVIYQGLDQGAETNTHGMTLVECLALHSNAIPNSYEEESQGFPIIPHLSLEDPMEKQRANSNIREVIYHMEMEENRLLQ